MRLSAVATRPQPGAQARPPTDDVGTTAAPTWRDAADLGRPRRRAVRPADRGHGAYLDRRRGCAAAVGHSARALSPDLRDRLFAAARSFRTGCVVAIQPIFIIGARRGHDLRADQDDRAASSRCISASSSCCALVCHGELARRRPAPRHLTAFYMWMSAGGMVGGHRGRPDRALHVQLDRRISDPDRARGAVPARAWRCRSRYVEQVDLLRRACGRGPRTGRCSATSRSRSTTSVYNWVVAALLIVTVLFWRDPLPFAAIIAFVLLANHYIIEVSGARSGAQLLRRAQDLGDRTTAVSACCRTAPRCTAASASATTTAIPSRGRPEPIMYYYDGSAMAQILDAARARKKPIRYAVIGLGTGTLACRAEPGDTVHYYEIDPAMIRMRDRSEELQLPERVPAGDDHARRRAAHARRSARRELRRHHRRCVHLRRHPDPPADPRGDGDLPPEAQRRTASWRSMCRTATSSSPRSWPASPRPTAWWHASTKAPT